MSEDTGVSGQQIFDMLMQSQFWPAEQMRDYQRSQLAQLLRHAKAHVPFYKTRLDCVLRKDSSIDWDRWEEIPIVTRADLRDRGAEMRSRVIPENHGNSYFNSSSGSTGVPITIQYNALLSQVATQAWARFFRAHGISDDTQWIQFKPRLIDGKPAKEEIIELPQPRSSINILEIQKLLPTARKLELLKSVKATHLTDLPTHLEVLARENLRQPQKVMLKVIVAIGMGVSNEQRQLFLESFGAKTLSPYSSQECTLIAFQCAHAPTHSHVNSEMHYFEILDQNGRANPLNTQGRPIITPFFNTAQPLIRYDQGDQVSMATHQNCQISLPIIQNIAGRSDPIFKFPSNDFALSYPNISLIQKHLNADAYQIAQTTYTHIEIRYVSPSEANQEGLNIVYSHFKAHFPPEVTLGFVRVSNIPYNAGGKQQRIVREFDL
jgi:phenylacetate-CoA ligase